jgi:hypothetical protein
MRDAIEWLAGLEAAATPGPWSVGEAAEVYPSQSGAPGCEDGCDGGCDDVEDAPYPCVQVEHARETVADCYGLLTHAMQDARLIATLRTVAPELLAVVRAAAAFEAPLAGRYADERWTEQCARAERARTAIADLRAKAAEAMEAAQ